MWCWCVVWSPKLEKMPELKFSGWATLHTLHYSTVYTHRVAPDIRMPWSWEAEVVAAQHFKDTYTAQHYAPLHYSLHYTADLYNPVLLTLRCTALYTTHYERPETRYTCISSLSVSLKCCAATTSAPQLHGIRMSGATLCVYTVL